MFKRGDVVESTEFGVGIVLQEQKHPRGYVNVWWVTSSPNNSGQSILAVALTPATNPAAYAFEVALELGDTEAALKMYREAQAAERERDEVRASYNAIHEIVWSEWFSTFPEYAFDGGQLPYHIKHLVDSLRVGLDAANTRARAVERLLWELTSDEAARNREPSSVMKDTAQAGVTSDEFNCYCVFCRADTGEEYGAVIHEDTCPIVRARVILTTAAQPADRSITE